MVVWGRSGDNIAGWPAMLAAGRYGGREMYVSRTQMVCMMDGFIHRLQAEAAAHLTDMVVELGTVDKAGGEEAGERMAAMAVELGLLEVLEKDQHDLPIRWRIDAPAEYLHNRTRQEVVWDRQRKADTSNVELTAPVRLRDGDACRYCSKSVQWNDQRSARGATYDHRVPGQAATIDTFVVACRGCNAARKDNPEADQIYPLKPPPLQPLYGPSTAAFLLKHLGIDVTGQRPAQAGTAAPLRPASQADTAAERPAHHADPAPVSDPATAGPRAVDEIEQDRTDRLTPGSGSPGSGRGRVGSGGAGVAAQGVVAQPPRRRSRSRRGRSRHG